MKALRFDLKGKTAFFKKPDVNTPIYFTYSHIHRLTLLGILGSVLGLGGYVQQEDQQYPEFYEKLKDLKFAIVPNADRGYFSKKIQVFNNTIGYASLEEGNVLNVREQWLENPSWTIYVLNEGRDEEMFQELLTHFQEMHFEYLPYLGKNDHPALIENAKEVALAKIEEVDYISSLYPKNVADTLRRGGNHGRYNPFFYEEHLPVALNSVSNGYEFENIAHTNIGLTIKETSMLYRDGDNILYFI